MAEMAVSAQEPENLTNLSYPVRWQLPTHNGKLKATMFVYDEILHLPREQQVPDTPHEHEAIKLVQEVEERLPLVKE